MCSFVGGFAQNDAESLPCASGNARNCPPGYALQALQGAPAFHGFSPQYMHLGATGCRQI